MKRLVNSSTIVGMYATDAAMLSNTQTSQPYWLNNNHSCALRYLPVLDYIRFNQNEEFTFCTDKHSEGLQAYNENNRLHPLSHEAIREKKINVSVNDLFCGDIDTILNFTGRYITATADTGIAKMFAPLDPTKFGELGGSIVVVSIVTLNSPSAVKDVYGYNDYIASLMAHTAGKTDYFSNENNRLFTFVQACITTNNLSARILSNTLKVVKTYSIVPSQLNIKEKESVYLYRKRIAFSFASLLEVPAHPDMTQEDEQAKLRMELERKKASNEALKQETKRFEYGYDIRKVDVDTRSLYNKGSYEEGKYQRDSTIETIKKSWWS